MVTFDLLMLTFDLLMLTFDLAYVDLWSAYAFFYRKKQIEVDQWSRLSTLICMCILSAEISVFFCPPPEGWIMTYLLQTKPWKTSISEVSNLCFSEGFRKTSKKDFWVSRRKRKSKGDFQRNQKNKKSKEGLFENLCYSNEPLSILREESKKTAK